MLMDRRQQGLGIRTDHLLDLLAVLEDDERGHGTDAELLCNVWDLVDVDLDEVRARELFREPGLGISVCSRIGRRSRRGDTYLTT